jgi:hypothetical protein
MNIKNLLINSAKNLKGLMGRLEIQASATRDRCDKADLLELIKECDYQFDALKAIAIAYGPMLQSAVNIGTQGHTHRIVVQVYAHPKDSSHDSAGSWSTVSTHEFAGVDTGVDDDFAEPRC